MKVGQKVKVSQIKSISGRTKPEIATLKALGLGRIGKSREFTVNAAVWGMFRKIRHLVQVTEA